MVRIYDSYILMIIGCSLPTQEILCFLSQTPAILFPHMLKYISLFSSNSPPAHLLLQLIKTRQCSENHDWLIFFLKNNLLSLSSSTPFKVSALCNYMYLQLYLT